MIPALTRPLGFGGGAARRSATGVPAPDYVAQLAAFQNAQAAKQAVEFAAFQAAGCGSH